MELRESIIEKSAQVFNLYGYKKTSMEDIANAAGKGKSSIYYYFKSKEEILIAVVRKGATELASELNKAVESTIDPIEKLKNYVLTRMKIYKKASFYYQAYSSHMHEVIPCIDDIRNEYDQIEIELLTSIIERGRESDKFAISEPKLAALAIATALKSLEEPIFNYTDDISAEETMNKLLEVLLVGIIKR